MKLKYIVAGIVGIGLIALAVISFDKSKIDYVDFDSASKSKKAVQVIGAWVKEKPAEYDAEKNTFTFYMTDKNNVERKVVFAGSRPNNFSQAPTIVVKGGLSGEEFRATEILTKCPSKYESKSPTEYNN